MMKRTFNRMVGAVTLATMLFSPLAQAVSLTTVRDASPTTELKICTTAPAVFYINGIMAPSEAAEAAAAVALQYRMDAYGQPHDGDVVSIYNPSEGLLLDIFRKLLAQKFGELIGTAWGFIEQSWRALHGVQNSLTGGDLDAVKQAARDAVSTTVLNGLDPAAAATLEKATTDVMTSASFGQKMLIVAHSQGNMFAKELYARTQLAIPNQYNIGAYDVAKQFQVVNVGTPATTSDTGKYVTSVQDIVIDLLARFLSLLTSPFQPAAPNFNSGTATYSYDALGHDFLNVYLNKQLGLEAQVMALTKMAADDAGSFGNDNAEGPLKIEGSANFGSVTYTVTADIDGGMTPVVTSLSAGMSAKEIFHPSCADLKPGTYHVQADIQAPVEPNSTQPWFAESVSLILPRLGPAASESNYGAFWFNYAGTSPMQTSVSAMDIVLTKDDISGGFDENIYYYRQPQ